VKIRFATASRLLAVLWAFSFCVLVAPAFAQGMRVLPSSPSAGEDFLIQYDGSTPSSPATVLSVAVNVSNQVILVSITYNEAGFSVPGAYRASKVVNIATPGTYQVAIQTARPGSPPQLVATQTITITAPLNVSPQFRSLTGLWWAPDEPGWALNVTQGDSGQLFALWYTYSPAFSNALTNPTNNMWLVMSVGRWTSGTEFRGLLYSTTGPPSNTPFAPSMVSLTGAGLATFRVLSAERLEFEAEAYVGLYSAITKRKTLQRFVF
jgi:hypothetical protein